MSIKPPFISIENISPHPADPCYEVWPDPTLEYALETAGQLGHDREIYLNWETIKVALELLAIDESEFIRAIEPDGKLDYEQTDDERYKLAP